MKNVKLAKLWDSLHSSYWFLPTIMLVGAIALSVFMLTLDREGYYGPLESWGWLYTGGTDGAREVLSAVSGSMITVAATAFSITIVAPYRFDDEHKLRVIAETVKLDKKDIEERYQAAVKALEAVEMKNFAFLWLRWRTTDFFDFSNFKN